MTKLLFKEVTIADPKSPFDGKRADVLIHDGIIRKIGSVTEPEATVHGGGTLSPGWVDMRVRLTEPGFEWKDDLRSLAKSAVAGGFTRVVCLPNTYPALDSRDFILSLVSRSESLPIYFHPYGALTKGAEGPEMAELFDMHQAGAVGFTNGLNSIQKSGILMRSLKYLHSFGGLLVNYPNDLDIARSGIVNEGPVSTRLGLKGVPAIAEEIMLARDVKLLEYFEHKMHIGPITTAGSVALLREAKSRFPALTAETSAMYLSLTDEVLEDFDPHYKVYPPLRRESDRQALCNAVKEGVIDVISSFHWPEGVEEKNLEFPNAEFGMAGLQTCFSLAYQALVAEGTLSLSELVQVFAHRPRTILGLPEVSLQEGSEAEFTWFDPESVWTPTKENWQSKSFNTPFLHRELKSVVKGIFAKGELIIC